ncbi:MAG TPA: DUF4266 domain-containing protein [Steroidobacteraceae bacterium]|jgi:hypothetical protein|nr:DUF4266 domain-containing protein [Steroidobacteraceae bacterium]
MGGAQLGGDVNRGRGRVAARLLLASLALLGSLAGCASVEPWVKPYEREHLADPIMALSRDGIAANYRDHVFETREGSHGATGAVGGGCGCN